MNGLDPSIVQDFLTESGELLEQLDRDLVALEHRARDADLLNRAFRALHTIKGSASFLALTDLVAIAHVAEGALSAVRNGTAAVDRAMMDLLLQATALLKRQFAALAAGEPLPSAETALVDALRTIGECPPEVGPGAEPAHAVEDFGVAPVCQLARVVGTAAELVRTSAATSLEEIAGQLDGVISAFATQAPGIDSGEVRARDVGPWEAGAAAAPDSTIRVEIARLEALLNHVGELMLQKDRVAALARQADALGLGTQEYRESLTRAIGGLDRTTGDIQAAVMRMRLQPLDKLFGRYPRLIRDLARKTNKKIQLVIEGGDTEVDKSVIEKLADPLVHLLRNSGDHAIESPRERADAGKPEEGTIRLVAENQGGHVSVRIIDDGRGLSRERIGANAVQLGLVTPQRLAEMSDREVWNFIFAPGFTTAAQVSDLSGRGVGMDVVRTNIEKIKGTVELWSEPGKGTTVTVKIPLTVSILPAMMVGVGTQVYAVPRSHVLEIVKPTEQQRGTVNAVPVLRLRDAVLPLIDARSVFDESLEGEAPFALVLASQEKRVGLLVSRLIGQQEIAIKPLDEMARCDGPVAGATVRDDGGVSLIVDVPRLIADAERARARAGVD